MKKENIFKKRFVHRHSTNASFQWFRSEIVLFSSDNQRDSYKIVSSHYVHRKDLFFGYCKLTSKLHQLLDRLRVFIVTEQVLIKRNWPSGLKSTGTEILMEYKWTAAEYKAKMQCRLQVAGGAVVHFFTRMTVGRYVP